MITIMIIMNMHNKLYTIFSHHLMTNSQSVLGSDHGTPNLQIFENFTKLLKKTRTPRKVQSPGQERIQTHGNKKEKKGSCHPASSLS